MNSETKAKENGSPRKTRSLDMHICFLWAPLHLNRLLQWMAAGCPLSCSIRPLGHALTSRTQLVV